MSKRVGRLAAGVMALALVPAVSAFATLDVQKKAKAAGVAATNCAYCHVEKLPKKGAATFSERGKWLMAQKDKRKAEAVDGAWLKEYVEPKK
jgi:hypothetical protein